MLSLIVLFGVPALWLTLCFVTSRLSAWYILAERYPLRSDSYFVDNSWTFQTARFGIVPYRSCVNFSTTRSGLIISVFSPFRFAHDPIFIPWDEFSIQSGNSLFFPGFEIRVEKFPSYTVVVSKEIAQEILEARLRPCYLHIFCSSGVRS